jgi:hypothetical protein
MRVAVRAVIVPWAGMSAHRRQEGRHRCSPRSSAWPWADLVSTLLHEVVLDPGVATEDRHYKRTPRPRGTVHH